ncbi:MAG: hypothetical protein R3F31_15890 [Verrucomicrobiales bacterium]
MRRTDRPRQFPARIRSLPHHLPPEEAVRLLAYRIYEDRKLKNLSGDHLSDWCAALEKLSSLRH